MKKLTDYLDDMKGMTGSDYKTAQELGYDRSAITHIRRTKKVSEETILKIAEYLNKPDEEILLAAMIDKSEGRVKKAWEKIAKAAHVLSVVFVSCQAVSDGIASLQCILCKIVKRSKYSEI